MQKPRKAEIKHSQVTPQRLGAKDCPNCHDSELRLDIKSIAVGANFVEICCNRCFREAVSEIHPRTAKAVCQAIERWNSIWPDVSEYLDSDTEGFKNGMC